MRNILEICAFSSLYINIYQWLHELLMEYIDDIMGKSKFISWQKNQKLLVLRNLSVNCQRLDINIKCHQRLFRTYFGMFNIYL